MRNVVTFDARGVSDCACVMNVLDGSNNINLIFEIGDYENPQIEIVAGDTTTTTALTVINGVAYFALNLSFFIENLVVKTRFIDGEKIGKQFIWIIENYLASYGVPYGYTLRVNRGENDIFTLSILNSNGTADGYDPNDFDVDDNGELSLKTPKNVTVAVNSDDQVTNVDFEYDNNYHKSFSIEWNENQKITKFGNLPINWS